MLKIKYIRLTWKELAFLIIILSMVFYSFLEKIIPFVNYIDDVFTVIIILVAIGKFIINIKKKKEKYDKNDKYIVIFLILLIFIGLIGNIVSKYQTSLTSIIIDIISFLKLAGVYLAGLVLFNNEKGEHYYTIAKYFSKIILIIITFIAIGNLVFNWGMSPKYARFGIEPYTLGGHPSFASAITCCCLSILLVEYKENRIWIILGLILTALTLRMKAIGYVVLMCLIIPFYKNKKEFKLRSLIVYGLIAVLLTKDYIIAYFFDESASRGVALISSIKLALEFLPLGAGFATFGTTGSTMNYSKAYSVLGIDDRYGFREDASSFVGDGGWATEIGQFGFLGAGMILFIIYLMYISVKKKISSNLNCIPYISIFLYLLISSTSETSISSNYAVLFAIVLVIIVKKGQSKNETGTKKE